MVENNVPFAPVSVVHYTFYDNLSESIEQLAQDDQIQCIAVSEKLSTLLGNLNSKIVRLGDTQQPSLTDYPDGIDTLAFLANL
jgi:hypothetical protein